MSNFYESPFDDTFQPQVVPDIPPPPQVPPRGNHVSRRRPSATISGQLPTSSSSQSLKGRSERGSLNDRSSTISTSSHGSHSVESLTTSTKTKERKSHSKFFVVETGVEALDDSAIKPPGHEPKLKSSHSTTHLYDGDPKLATARFDSPSRRPAEEDILRFRREFAGTTTEYIIKAEMSRRESEFIDLTPFRVFIGTYNVNGKSGDGVDLRDWLACDPAAPDMYAIGFQELDLSKEAYVFTESAREEQWVNACLIGLHPDAEYSLLRVVRLIGMMLVIFVKKEHELLVCNLAAKTVGTGLLGTMGNKGGVSIRFDFGNTSLCFVNCHLAAHMDEVDRRNQDIHEIGNRTIFPQFRPVKKIFDHDQIYWFGDMNYRLAGKTEDIISWVEDIVASKDSFQSLFDCDQLHHERKHKRVFEGFEEEEIRFKPTYKYDVGGDNWDSSEKRRCPAWTDRVLYKSKTPSHIQVIRYKSHPSLTVSDHKPVSALFTSMVKIVDPNKYRNIYTEIMKKLDRLENDYLPQVMLDITDLDFGIVQFKTSNKKSVTIANTGQVPVHWNFAKKPNQPSYCKEWLIVKPSCGEIVPGDAIEVEVEVFVDQRTAGDLQSGKDSINDILVLHLERGRDLFITISGRYLCNLMDDLI